MDTYLAVVAKREVREYTDRPVPEEILTKILQAGRAAGSSKNSQPWRFVVLKERQHRHDLADAMMAPRNLDRCAVAIAVVLLNERLRFGEVAIHPDISRASDELGFMAPTPVQTRAIPILQAGRDLFAQAQTGTGKTAAFAIPILEKVDATLKRPQALVVVPTRELALQV